MDLLRSFLSLVVWNNSFEDSPSGGDDPSYGDDEITLLKEAIRERLEKEHKMNLADGTVSNDGWHKPGTALVYYQASEPTTRPDGTTALDTNDNGRLWIRSTDYVLHVYIHAEGWKLLTTMNAQDNTLTGINSFTEDIRIPTSTPTSPANGSIWME